MRLKTTLILIILLVGISNLSIAQLPANCNGINPRIAIAGDSWAQYMADDGTHSEMLKMYGHGDKTAISETFEKCVGCIGTPGANDYAVSGSEAREWADEVNYDYLQNLIDALNANPTIDWVVLSIGGNDVLAARSNGGWYKNMDLDVAGSEAALFNTVKSDIEYIINQVWLRSRTDINFVISGYDYPNFNVTSFCSSYACPKREDLSRDDNNNGSIDGTELITDVAINSMMQVVEAIRQNMADNMAQVYYDNGMGLMHYYYGYDDGLYTSISIASTAYPLGIAPYTIGGDPNTPTDRDNFRPVGVFGWIGWFGADPIHLDFEAYQYKIKNQMDNILFDAYRGEPTETFWSNTSEDGWVEVYQGNSFSTNGLRMGDEDISWYGLDYDYRSILSFNTSTIPANATITGASLYLFRSSATDNPFFHNDRNPVLDIKNGYFGTSAALEQVDGLAVADAVDVGCFNSKGDQNKYAVRIDIDATGLAHINTSGTTQFRTYFDLADWDTELINFYDGGGIAGRITSGHNEIEPLYQSRVIKRTENPDGTFTEVEISRGEAVIRQDGFNHYEKMQSAIPNNDGSTTVTYSSVMAIEHPGLSKYMTDKYAAPANGFAPFLDVKYELPLPVELMYFMAFANNQTVDLTWTTASEEDVNGFYIEHSLDGKFWEEIGFKTATNSQILTSYEYQHLTPQIGNNYYRLRILDLDETFDYSPIRVVNFQNENQINVYPNPFEDRLVFEIKTSKTKTAIAYLINSIGQVVYQKRLQLFDNQQIYILNDLNSLEKGIYMLRIESQGIEFSQRVLRK